MKIESTSNANEASIRLNYNELSHLETAMIWECSRSPTDEKCAMLLKITEYRLRMHESD